MTAYAKCIEVSFTRWLEINFCINGFPDTEQHLLDLLEKLKPAGSNKLYEVKRKLEEMKANCLPALARTEECGAAISKAEEVEEIREKLEVITEREDNTIASGEAAVQKVMNETLHHYCSLLDLGSAAVSGVLNSRQNGG